MEARSVTLKIKGGEVMMKRSCVMVIVSLVFGLVLAGVAAAQQYPILDDIANRVVQKYQTSNCEQLWQQKGQPKTAIEQQVIQTLHNDPQMRAEFFRRVSTPIVTKMFECGMIP
jgi:hypothetical protein